MLKDDGDRRIAGRKLFKRSRPDQTVLQVTESQMDLGVLLGQLLCAGILRRKLTLM